MFPIDDNLYQSIPIDINQSIDTDNGWPIDCKDLCGYRMVLIGFSIIHFHWLEMPRQVGIFKYTSNGVYSLHWEDWVGIVSIEELFLCGYWLIIDWPIPTNTRRYQLTHFIDWLVFRSSISIDWKQREGILHLFFFSLLTLLILKLLFFADIINPWKYNTES